MAEHLEQEMRRRLRDLDANQQSLDRFREWFAPLSLNIEQSGDEDAIQLAYRIDGVLAESSSADWSDADLREELARIACPFVVRAFAAAAQQTTPLLIANPQEIELDFSASRKPPQKAHSLGQTEQRLWVWRG